MPSSRHFFEEHSLVDSKYFDNTNSPFLDDNFIVDVFLSVSTTKSLLLKTHLMETRRMEHENALDFALLTSLKTPTKKGKKQLFLFYRCFPID